MAYRERIELRTYQPREPLAYVHVKRIGQARAAWDFETFEADATRIDPVNVPERVRLAMVPAVLDRAAFLAPTGEEGSAVDVPEHAIAVLDSLGAPFVPFRIRAVFGALVNAPVDPAGRRVALAVEDYAVYPAVDNTQLRGDDEALWLTVYPRTGMVRVWADVEEFGSNVIALRSVADRPLGSSVGLDLSRSNTVTFRTPAVHAALDATHVRYRGVLWGIESYTASRDNARQVAVLSCSALSDFVEPVRVNG